MNGVVVGAMVATHLHVQLADSTVDGGVPELLVHVVLTGTRLVLQHHAVGLDEVGSLLEDLHRCCWYLMDRQDLALSALELLLGTHVIPELRLCHDLVRSEDSESEDGGVGVLLSGVAPAEHDVLADLHQFKLTFICSEGSVGSWADFLAILTMGYWWTEILLINIRFILLEAVERSKQLRKVGHQA